MKIEILCFFVYLMNLFCFLLVIYGVENWKEAFVPQINAGRTILLFTILLFLRKTAANYIEDNWSFLFAAEFFILLIWTRQNRRSVYVAALKGCLCMIGIFATELTIIAIYHLKDHHYFEQGLYIYTELQIICGLGIMATQFLLLLILEIIRVKGSFRKSLMLTLGIKALEDMVWLYVCIWASVFEIHYYLVVCLFLIGMFTNYVVLLIVRLKIEVVSEQQKRADMHMNTYEYYLNMEEEHLQIRKMYHEMKNQLMIMGETAEKQVQRPDSKLTADLKKLQRFYHTGNAGLDMLLFDAKMRAEARQIAFEAVVTEGCLNFMKDEDINIIFSNALINAIEACEKIKSGPKKITVKAGENANDTIIYVKNTVNAERQRGSLKTNKKNKILHGIGMGSIQECVEKYQGYISIIEEEGSFQLAILFGKE